MSKPFKFNALNDTSGLKLSRSAKLLGMKFVAYAKPEKKKATPTDSPFTLAGSEECVAADFDDGFDAGFKAGVASVKKPKYHPDYLKKTKKQLIDQIHEERISFNRLEKDRDCLRTQRQIIDSFATDILSAFHLSMSKKGLATIIRKKAQQIIDLECQHQGTMDGVEIGNHTIDSEKIQ